MLETNVEEVVGAFSAAKNANAALKNFLKKEVRAGDPAERFAKDFRAAVSSGRPPVVKAYIERNFPQNEIYFLVFARYAHAEVIASIVENIFKTYADDFNSTYEKLEKGIKIKDKGKFSSIVKSVLSMIDEGLKASNLPATNFLKKSVLICVFEEDVLKEVMALV